MSLLIALIVTPALHASAFAETPLTAEAFEARVTGRTLTYSYGGVPFGTEEYFPNRRVAWARVDDGCVYGRWYDKRDAAGDDEICFVYEDRPDPQCWLFHDHGGRLTALFVSDGPGAEPSDVTEMDGPLSCPGPDAGV